MGFFARLIVIAKLKEKSLAIMRPAPVSSATAGTKLNFNGGHISAMAALL